MQDKKPNDQSAELQRLDQSLAVMADTFPPMWHRMYRNCIDAGFDKDQAQRIIIAHVHGAAGGKLLNP